ncbi:MAG: acyl carrier protein [Kiritimatiellae bacterium]|nr:acyl carrier protein [Kiritimatiellia bacterium]
MKRKALFVGVDQYDDGSIHDLQCAANDAALILSQFRAIGYEAGLLTNPNRDQVMKEFVRMTEGLGAGDEFLFYFAGHGFIAPGGEHLLFCRDDFYENIQFNYAGIPFGMLQAKTERTGFNRMFILDACQSNPFTTRGTEQTRDLLPSADSYVKNVRSGGLAVMRSCAPGECALELPSERRGVFSLALDRVIDGCRRNGGELAFDQSFAQLVYGKMGEIARENRLRLNQTPEIKMSANWGHVVLVAGRTTVSPRIVKCPSCGFRNEESETFQCRICGRDYLCKRHYEASSNCCAECAAKGTANVSQPTGDSTLGEILRNAREAKKLSVAQVASATGLLAQIIQDLENDDYRRVQASIYGKGFVRLYAECVGLDAKPLVKMFLSVYGDAPSVPPPPVLRAGETKQIVLPGQVKMEFRWCPPGTFEMGSPMSESGRDGREVRHRVTLTKGFWMGRFPVTREQWDSVMETNPSAGTMERKARDVVIEQLGVDAGQVTRNASFVSDLGADSLDAVELVMGFEEEFGATISEEEAEKLTTFGKVLDYLKSKGFADGEKQLPQQNVSWLSCQAFVEKVNAVTGCGMRLPTEAEWEYACRAGTNTPYSGTGSLDGMGWYGGNSGNEPHPVGTKASNAWGLYDMHGNVCEWCADWYGDYPSRSVTDPVGPSQGTYRVIRGGSWKHDADLCRSASRSWGGPGHRDHNLGFRVVLVPDS